MVASSLLLPPYGQRCLDSLSDEEDSLSAEWLEASASLLSDGSIVATPGQSVEPCRQNAGPCCQVAHQAHDASGQTPLPCGQCAAPPEQWPDSLSMSLTPDQTHGKEGEPAPDIHELWLEEPLPQSETASGRSLDLDEETESQGEVYGKLQ